MSGGAFEVVGPDGRVVFASSDPPTGCDGGPPCGGCDTCATRHAGDSFTVRPARPWVAWPGLPLCRRCGAGRYLAGRCERCGEPERREGRSWSAGEDRLAGHLLLVAGSRTLSVADLVALVSPRTGDDA